MNAPSLMNFPIDIHTHRLPEVAGKAIVNCYPEAFAPQEDGWFSVGIHPWHIDTAEEDNRSVVLSRAKSLLPKETASHPQVLAIGEAGLDKLAKASLSLQTEIFEYQARLSMEVDKPLIIHLVKAADELLKLKQTLRPVNPWIIHGFRGKAALAQEFLRHGFYLSFGEKYQEEALRIVPSERLFIETDEGTMLVEELYERAAHVRGVTRNEVWEKIQQNIRKVFFRQ